MKKQPSTTKQKRTKTKVAGAVKKTPRTIENSKGVDPSIPPPEQLGALFNNDEFASFFREERVPNIVVTTTRRAHRNTIAFASELATIFGGCGGLPSPTDPEKSQPPARFLHRKAHHTIDYVMKEAIEANTSDLLVVGERLKTPFSLTMIHLPNGPTAYFKLSSVTLSKELGREHGSATPHPPELNMANFNTVLGMTVGRFLTSLFPFKPQFKGRQIVTFHNQRDFIFFRRHRYIFQGVEGGESTSTDDATPSVRTQELGPRFTLKLEALQKGAFRSSDGEYIWVRSSSKMRARKQFYL